MSERQIEQKGYAHPEALVSTDWVAEHLDDLENIRIVESDEDVLLYEVGHIPNAVKIDWVEDLNDPLVRDYLDRMRRGDRVPTSVLTAREDQVIKLIAEGRSSREIAKDLHIALKTVEGHRANILGKLGMRDRVELTRYAIRAGLIEP